MSFSIKKQADQSLWLLIAEENELTRDELRKEIAKDIDPLTYSLRNLSLKVPESAQQFVIDSPVLDLREIVAMYVKARRSGNENLGRNLFGKMETLVEDLL